MITAIVIAWFALSGWIFFGDARTDYDFSGQLTGLAMFIAGVAFLLGSWIF